ncbi:hypothetical protein OsI_21229 [Oryza sativa Indica Group]|uniref:Uncharacterized protein n=2 Tax=Oryza sativa TaxID=4530 RepID=B9FJ09_ORYSJ|nr:hypothetical protein OsI_21229 [Oryza sativa Indica Group]EEE64910.1 hypothetical protein OsJ_19770 [Oryza sativa Japonica Group]
MARRTAGKRRKSLVVRRTSLRLARRERRAAQGTLWRREASELLRREEDERLCAVRRRGDPGRRWCRTAISLAIVFDSIIIRDTGIKL